MEEFIQLIAASLLSSTVVAGVITIVFKARTEKIANEIKNQFELLQMMQKSGHAWKEKAISELFGPLCFQLSRTQSAFNRYKTKNLFLEAEVLKNSNQKIRDLLLEKSYLIPPELTEHAKNLVEHYDVWLEEFNRLREGENQAQEKNFVFVGPKGFLFPKNAEKKFREKYEELWQAMYQY